MLTFFLINVCKIQKKAVSLHYRNKDNNNLIPKSRKGTRIMAKYTINHTCGHQVTIQLFGAYKDRERRIAYLETCECDECRKAKANAAAAAAKEERGLSDLTGSEKQVAWANTIREKAYKALDGLEPFNTNDKTKALFSSWRAKLDSQTEAKWWIDNRYSMPDVPCKYADERLSASSARSTVADFRNLFDEWEA